jgi:hypothetical protein
MSFVVPMVWREEKDHTSNHHFYLSDASGHTSIKKPEYDRGIPARPRKRCGKNVTSYKKKHSNKYVNLLPALILRAHKEKLPAPNISESWDLEDDAEMDVDDMYHDAK